MEKSYCKTCRKKKNCKEVCQDLRKYLIYHRFRARNVSDEEFIEYFLYAVSVANLSKTRIIKIIKVLARYSNSHLYNKLKEIKKRGEKLVNVFLPKRSKFKEISTDPQKMDKSKWYQG